MFILMYKQTKVSTDKVQTEISIRQDSPYNHITSLVDGDHTHKPDEELIELALREFYKMHFAVKYQNEMIDTIATDLESIKGNLGQEIKEIKKVVLAGDLTDGQLTELLSQYPAYKVGAAYIAGDVFKNKGVLYEVIQDHTSQADWLPETTASLYKLFLNGAAITTETEEGTTVETEVINEFVQPTGAHDSYMIGDKVLFEGKVYESLIDNNAYSPVAYPAGWSAIE